jgi:hypothetical protein
MMRAARAFLLFAGPDDSPVTNVDGLFSVSPYSFTLGTGKGTSRYLIREELKGDYSVDWPGSELLLLKS